METLPPEVITDILIRVPAKSVSSCKCVCKLWYNLIDGPDFNTRHLEQSLAARSNLHFVFRAPGLHLADFETFDNPVELGYPFKQPDNGGANVVGECHGLLCLWAYDYQYSLFLYNPTTRTHKILPPIPGTLPLEYPRGHFNFGFGYDEFSRDYKSVRIRQTLIQDTGSFACEVMVYSLKVDSWRRVQDVPYYFYNHRGGSALVGGAIYWVGEDDNQGKLPIVRFDLKDETFSSIPLPKLPEWVGRLSVGVLDGFLCLMVNHLSHYDLWIMKGDGMRGSWMLGLSLGKRMDSEQLERTVSFSISRKELFLRLSVFQTVKLDLKTREITDVKVADFNRCLDAWVCVENLAMLDDDECDDFPGEQRHGSKKSSKNRRRRKQRKNRRL